MRVCNLRAAGRATAFLLFLASTAFSQKGLLSPAEITDDLRMFAPAALTADTSGLVPGDRSALHRLIEAGRLLERIYLRQNTPGGDTLPASLASDTSVEGGLRHRYFLLNMSPWSSFDRGRAIVPGVPVRQPQQANLYPPEMNRGNWGGWFIGLDAARQAEAAGPYHVVRMDSAGGLFTVSYSREYADLLSPAGKALDDAARTATNAGLRKYLSTLSGAFGTDDYGAAEAALMEAGGPLLFVAGPTSLILDNLFRHKRAYEVIVGVKNEGATTRLREMEKLLPEIAKELGTPAPPPEKQRSGANRRSLAVVDAVFIGGAARSGALASTLRLPVDTALVAGHGTTAILLRNVHEAAFAVIAPPIARAMLDSSSARLVSSEAHLAQLSMRELCARLRIPGSTGAAAGGDAAEAADPGSVLSLVRDDAAALVGLEMMARKGGPGKTTADGGYATQIVSLLRALRFWGDDPVSAAAAIEFNFHREQGALRFDPAGSLVRIDFPVLRKSVRALHKAIASLQDAGDAGAAAAFLSRYAAQPPELRGLRERLSTIPIDLEPAFPLAR